MPENLYCKGQLTLSEEGRKNFEKIVWDDKKHLFDSDEWFLVKYSDEKEKPK